MSRALDIAVRDDLLSSLIDKDFPRFGRWVFILHNVSKEMIPFHYDNWRSEQQKFEEERTGRDIILKSRATGFSTMECVRNLFYALAHPNRTVLLVTDRNQLAVSLLETIKGMYEAIAELAKKHNFGNVFPFLSSSGKRGTKSSSLLIKFANGSKIVGTTAGTTQGKAGTVGRGLSIDRCHFTEISHWPFPDAVITSIAPALAKHAEIVIESTPNNAGDFFHRTYQDAKAGSNEYKAHFFRWYEHSEHTRPLRPGETIEANTEIELQLVELGCSEEQIAFWRSVVQRSKGVDKALTEYPIDDETCFFSSGRSFLSFEEQGALSQSITEPLSFDLIGGMEFRIFEEPQPNIKYCLGADTALGGQGDDHAIVILREDTGRLVCAANRNNLSQKALGHIIEKIATKYNSATVAVETTRYSDATLDALKGYPNPFDGLFSTIGVPCGFTNSSESRPRFIETLHEWITGANGQTGEPLTGPLDQTLVHQLNNLYYDPSGKVVAQGKTKKGIKDDDSPKDDLCIAYAIALFVRSESVGAIDYTWTPIMTSGRSQGQQEYSPLMRANRITRRNLDSWFFGG